MMKKTKRCQHDFEYVRPNRNDAPGECQWEPCTWDESPNDDFQFCFKCGQEANYNG